MSLIAEPKRRIFPGIVPIANILLNVAPLTDARFRIPYILLLRSTLKPAQGEREYGNSLS